MLSLSLIVIEQIFYGVLTVLFNQRRIQAIGEDFLQVNQEEVIKQIKATPHSVISALPLCLSIGYIIIFFLSNVSAIADLGIGLVSGE